MQGVIVRSLLKKGVLVNCETAWSIFLAEAPRAQMGESFDEKALASANWHIDDCTACMAKREELSKPSPAPAAVTPKQTSRNSFLYHVVKAIGFPPEEVSARTPLGPLSMARFLISLTKERGARQIKPAHCFPGMTVGGVVVLYEASPRPVLGNPTLEELDIPPGED